MERSPVVLTGARWKSFVRAVLSFAFAASGLWMVLGGVETERYPAIAVKFIGLLVVLTFGFNAALTSIRVAKPAKLVLSKEGFWVEGIRRSELISWESVQAFGKVSVGLASCPAFRLKPGLSVRDQTFTRRIVQDYDGTIAVFPSCGVDRTVKTLSEWREHYAKGASPSQV